MKIAIVGTGYQGLVTGTCFAENGHQVICMDRDEARISMLNAGETPLHEPGLEELITRNREEERLCFTTRLDQAVAESLMVFLCVGATANEQGHADISGVLDAAERIAEAMDGYRIIVNRTTCPPGTAEKLEETMRMRTGHPHDIVVNPDFTKEGTAVDDFLRPDRIVVGCEDIRVREIMKELYSPFLRTGKPFIVISRRSAEMAKYATNVMLAARISLMNQLADICKAHDCDIAEVREAVAADYRIGPTFLFPGIGFGGVGLPRDLSTCEGLALAAGINCDLITAIREVNEKQREHFLQQILEYYGADISKKRLAVWGASFKARTDDLRGGPAIYIIDGLRAAGAAVTVYDPVAGRKLKERYGEAVMIAPKYYGALENADGLVIMTEWNEFRRPDYGRMAELMREKVIFDGRNLYTPSVLAGHGFRYFSIGRKSVG
ncbi:MAG TPA: UDP-glucose/GDP-mannose dehydrogenase family protein [Candidatus Hydrogenedentes bacterium]|nr:UDP-glucose/GDP-mannose dehydrogenase family protein [Candidatus Hydrogenedentota bacterium]